MGRISAVFFFISCFCFPTTASLSSLVLKVVGYLLGVSPTKDFHSRIGILKMFHFACVNLSHVKDLNPCRQDVPLWDTDYGK